VNVLEIEPILYFVFPVARTLVAASNELKPIALEYSIFPFFEIATLPIARSLSARAEKRLSNLGVLSF
jgi:hypothetical protein